MTCARAAGQTAGPRIDRNVLKVAPHLRTGSPDDQQGCPPPDMFQARGYKARQSLGVVNCSTRSPQTRGTCPALSQSDVACGVGGVSGSTPCSHSGAQAASTLWLCPPVAPPEGGTASPVPPVPSPCPTCLFACVLPSPASPSVRTQLPGSHSSPNFPDV